MNGKRDIRIPLRHNSENRATRGNCLRLLKYGCKSYKWGKTGSKSLVARMAKANNDKTNALLKSRYELDEAKTYAELWLGTHRNGMSEVLVEHDLSDLISGDEKKNDDQNDDLYNVPRTENLSTYIGRNPSLHCTGEAVATGESDTKLGFLLKVLSVEKALSLQAHPDKKLAQQLYSAYPDQFDSNHKPELAISLSDDFEALCGFRRMTDLAKNLKEYPELASIVGDTVKERVLRCIGKSSSNHKENLMLFFRAFANAVSHNSCQVHLCLEALLQRLLHKAPLPMTTTDQLILKLSVQYPDDPGIFAPIFMNHIRLRKGQALYIGANEPHAYIQGDLIECMASSDNVIRMGLTSKYKDMDMLVNMLSYHMGEPEILSGEVVNDFCRLYRPPVDDFAVEVFHIEAPAGSNDEKGVGTNRSVPIPARSSPSLLLVLEGKGSLEQTLVDGEKLCVEASFGNAFFMSADTSATLKTSKTEAGRIQIVRAFSNVCTEP